MGREAQDSDAISASHRRDAGLTNKRGRFIRRVVVALSVCLMVAGVLSAAPASSNAQSPDPVRYVLGFHDFAPMSNAEKYAGEQIQRRHELLRYVVVTTRNPQGLESHANGDPNVRYIEKSPEMQLIDPIASANLGSDREDAQGSAERATPNDPLYETHQYGPQQIGAPLAWNVTSGPVDAAVCVIDTGVRRSHEDVPEAGRWWGWHDFVNGRADPYDDNGHGTHVTGIAAAKRNNNAGIAGLGHVGVYAAKALPGDGSGSWEPVADAIVWCANQPSDRVVINLSLGASAATQTVADAVNYAHHTKKQLLVAASGNDSCSGCIGYPAKYPEVIAATCTTISQTSCAFTSKGEEAEASAPGESIASTYNSGDSSYLYASGTSMSAPHVSGALTDGWRWHDGWPRDALRTRLQNSARDLGTSGHDDTFGHGLADMKCIVDIGPYPPQNVDATPGSGIGEIDLSWSEPEHDCNWPIKEYRIQRATSFTGPWDTVASVGGGARTWTDTGRVADQTYWYRIRAVNDAARGVLSIKDCSKPYPSVEGVC